MTRECPRAADLLSAMTAGPSPAWMDGELKLHVEACESCRDLATVVSALRAERDHIRRTVTVPSAGLVWWRAQLRQRQLAALKASAPVTAIHAAALAGAVVLAAVLVLTLGRSVGVMSLAGYPPTWPSWTAASQLVVTDFPILRYGLALGATAWLILGPVALYFAFRRD
jgi:hypothetical protein